MNRHYGKTGLGIFCWATPRIVQAYAACYLEHKLLGKPRAESLTELFDAVMERPEDLAATDQKPARNAPAGVAI